MHPNRPYSLATEHGRSQSIAHSAHGAYLADTIEQCVQEELGALAEKIEQLIEKEMAHLNPVPEENDLHAELSIFQSELGKRDSKEFQPLLNAYSEEWTFMQGNIALLKKLLEEIKTVVGIDDGEEQETE